MKARGYAYRRWQQSPEQWRWLDRAQFWRKNGNAERARACLDNSKLWRLISTPAA
jgi:hypothetical protein